MQIDPQAPLIEISNATVWRGTTRVLTDFSLTIPRHQNIAILGPNGAGKTTLLELITRQLYPVAESGSRVRILGRERWNVRELRQQLGIVSHDLQVDYGGHIAGRDVVLSGFSASEGVRHVSYAYSESQRSEAAATMTALGITDLADTPYGHMSTGEQRRFLLARSLVTNPHTLVMDEPLNGLDLTAAFKLLRIMSALMARGVCLLLVTHHVGEIPPAIERILLLQKGKIMADGAKAEILTSDRLSQLYGTPVRLTETAGYFSAVPG